MKYSTLFSIIGFLIMLNTASSQSNVKATNLIQHLNSSFKDKLTPKFYQNFMKQQRLVTLENDRSNHPQIKFFRNPDQATYRLVLEEGCVEPMEAMLVNFDGDIVFNAIFYRPTVDFRLNGLPHDTYYLKVTNSSGSYTKTVELTESH